MLKIANFVTDDKFIDSVIDIQEMLSRGCAHDYIHVTAKKDKPFEYVKRPERLTLLRRREVLPYLTGNGFDAVFLHNFFSLPWDITCQIGEGIKVFWFAWGWDIYSTPQMKPAIDMELYHPETRSAIPEKNPPGFIEQREYDDYVKAVKRVDYFSGILPSEYDLMRQNPYFRARPVTYVYTKKAIIDRIEGGGDFCEGENIIVGNSADPACNHLDVLPYLSKLDIGDRKVYLPLSYSGSRHYAELVARRYKEVLGESAVVLSDFVPFEEYSKIWQSCGYGIFFSERQQANGSLVNMSWNGCKLFLSETSIGYKYLSGIGMKLFTVQGDLEPGSWEAPLTPGDRRSNREIIYKMRSRQAVSDVLSDICKIIGET